MFDSLDDQIKKDLHEQTSTKQRLLLYLAVLIVAVLVFGGLIFGVRMIEG